MDDTRRIYRAKLDFLYQSIAMYAVTIVVYLVARSLILSKAFPTLWQDPLLILLCAITIVSIIALLYNIYMRRQLQLEQDKIVFSSRARERSIRKADIQNVEFGRERIAGTDRGVRVVKIRVKTRRRPVRIRLSNFEHGKRLLHDLKEWSGPLASSTRSRLRNPLSGSGGRQAR